MSHVVKTGPTVAPSPGASGEEPAERAPKAGEFEAVLRDKGQAAGRAESPGGGGRAEGRGSDGRATDGRATEGKATDRKSTDAAETRPARSRSAAEAPSGDRERGEAGGWRALPGDVAVPARPDAARAALETSRAADAVARIERIAEQIVRGVEVRLGPGGAGEVRLELDLGGLGQLRVAVARDAQGAVAVRFDGAGAEATRLLSDRGQELVARLEARGIALREVALTGADGSLVRIGSPSGPAGEDLASRLPDEAARAREQAWSRQSEDQRRRGRGTEAALEDEEE